MSAVLYRIGRFAFGHRLLTVAVWVLVLFAAGASTLLAKPYQMDFSLPGTETERAAAMLEEHFPGQGDMDQMAAAKVVVQAPPGQRLDGPASTAALDALVGQLRELDHLAAPQAIVNPVTTPPMAAQVNPDRTIAYVDVPFDQAFTEIDAETVDAFEQALQVGRDGGLTVEATGTLFNGQPPQQGLSEAMGFGVALIVMIIAFASVVAATVPIITAIVGVGTSVALITGATALVNMDTSALLIASMIGIAVSIDYSLFIMSRYRSALDDTDDRAHAVGTAVGTAGSSVVFAGLTVVIALVALRVVNIPFLSIMGYTAAVTVIIAVLVATTLLPALLGWFGGRVFAARVPGLHPRAADTDTSRGARWAKLVVAHPVAVLVGAVVALGVVALPVTKLELGMDFTPADQKRAVELIGEGFGEGVLGPLVVVVDAADAANPGAAYSELAAAIGGQDDVAMVIPPQPNDDGSGALITVIPQSGPTSAATQDLVHQIRDLEAGFTDRTGIAFGVTGQTAVLADLSEALLNSLLPYLLVIVGLAYLVLMTVFRSLLVPLTATLGFLLSIGATFGATVAVFQLGWFGIVDDPGPIISFLPVFLIGIVFGLAMDYQVFLVTRMREAYIHGPQTREGALDAVRVGFRHGARVVTAAAVIMISVFAAFMLSPETVAKSVGFAMAVAVLFDAFLVRMTAIPALMALLGERAWYLPDWLDRILPDVDIEGRRIEQVAHVDTESVGAAR
ncbi:MMPL family transporter [Mycobacterium sp. pV006]|uniref:MMPL family transporter n=1 Tax=Mycobacterium sp. pV006 TaxID=3238983 RepID=UPI00351B4DFE